MKTKILNIAFAIMLMMISTQVLSQTYLISQGGTITTCSGTIYDSGGPSGNYSSNENYVITICGDLPGATMTLEFTSFTFESPTWDYLSIYDGSTTASPEIITNQGYTSLQGVTIEATGDCITLFMHTDGSGQYTGFAADISCGFPCQDYTVDIISSNPSLSPPADSLWIDVCQGTDIEFTAQGDYPNNNTDYAQSDATLQWNWRVVKESATVEYSGVGLNTITHTFMESGGYRIYLETVDINGCIASIDQFWRVRVSITPLFVGTHSLQDTVCPYEPVDLIGIVTPVPWEEEFMDEIAQTTFLPDGSGVTYSTSITNGTFTPGETVDNVNDIISLCVNMEHTYQGDISMELVCPNGQTMVVFDQGGGGNILGEPVGTNLPVDGNSSDITPGIGYDYCWSPTSTAGFIDDDANATYLGTYTDPIGNVSTGVDQVNPGTYQIDGNWTDLIGCPLNGSWTIFITDHMNLDNGYIFSWQITFAPELIPTNLWYIENSYDPDDMIWTGNGINPNSGGTAVANPTISGDQTYTFTVTDDFGCPHDTTINVHVRNADDALCCEWPTANAGPDAHVCTNTYTFNASLEAGNTGTWSVISGPGNVTWANQNSQHAIATVDTWGVYRFRWTEQNQTPTCCDTDSLIVEFYPIPTTTFTFNQIMCNQDHTTITYTGNVGASATYNWDFDGASVVSGSGQGPYEIFWTDAGIHSIGLQIDANGCSSDDTLVNITNPALLSHTLVVDDDPCFESCRGRAELTLEGGTLPYSYSWGSPTNILSNLCAGDYGVTVTDHNGCTTGQTYTVTEPPVLVINSTSTTNLTCYQSHDGEIIVDASGGTGNLTYLWSDIGLGTADRLNIAAGDYCLTVNDENGCFVMECFEITQPDELLVTVGHDVAICEGTATAVQAQAMGGTTPYTYNWNRGEGYTVAGPTLNVSLDTTTTFNVYVEDNNGCISNTATMIVTVSPKMIIDSMILRNNRCYNSCDGRAEILMHGGIAPFQYSWGSSTNIYSGLCADIYTVTVSDIIGCKVSEMFIITEPPQITYTTDNNPASCYGYNDGEAAIFVQGGVPPYSYLWPNGHDEYSMLNHAGNYSVTVLDDHLCRVTTNITIQQPDAIYVQPIGNRTICQGQTTMLTTQATGGTPYYDFHWTGTDSTVYHSNQYNVSPTQTTTYTLVVTDSHGCSSTPRISIVTVNPDLEILSTHTSNDTVCSGDPAIIHVDVEGGNGGPYLMTLQDGRVVPSPFTVYPDTTTLFYITLNDMCGTPSVVDSILINVRPKPGNVFVVEDVDGCPPFAANFTESTPDLGQTYLWQFGDDGFSTDKSPIHIYKTPGTYTVSLEVMDHFGCKSTRTVENMITVFPKPTALFEADPEVVSMLSAEVHFINYSTDADNYYWFFGDGDSSLFVSPRHLYPTIGEYEVLLIAATMKNCKDTASRIVTVRNEFAFYMPNSFTPNGDGINDCFRPCGNGIDKNSFTMLVYDRWGNLVFNTEKFDLDAPCDACSNGAWDGTDNGSRVKGDEILPNGLYHWYCEFLDWDGTLYKEQGTVTLTR